MPLIQVKLIAGVLDQREGRDHRKADRRGDVRQDRRSRTRSRQRTARIGVTFSDTVAASPRLTGADVSIGDAPAAPLQIRN